MALRNVICQADLLTRDTSHFDWLSVCHHCPQLSAVSSQVQRSEHRTALCSAVGELLLRPYTVAHIMELNPYVSISARVSRLLSHGYANGPRLQSIHLKCREVLKPLKYKVLVTDASMFREIWITAHFNGTYRSWPQSKSWGVASAFEWRGFLPCCQRQQDEMITQSRVPRSLKSLSESQ